MEKVICMGRKYLGGTIAGIIFWPRSEKCIKKNNDFNNLCI